MWRIHDTKMSTITGRAVRRKTSVAPLLLGTALALAGLLGMAASASAQASTDTVVRLPLDGVVDPFVADFLEGGIAEAADDGAAAVLIEIDTPGGLVTSTRRITQATLNAEVPVVCYVAPSGARAASAGAFVLMSCDVAAMAPGTNVGAATPVGLDGAVGSDKAVNDAAASMRALAEEHGRNADLAESFVTEAVSISAEEALESDVIEIIAPSTEDLLSQADGRTVTVAGGDDVSLGTAGAEVVDRDMGGFVGFLHRLLDPTLAFLFFWLGLGLIVLELIVPGHVLSGTIGTAMLILSIVSFGALPVQLIGLALLVGAAVLMVVELNAPGFGVWGIAGTICLVLGGWFLYDRAGGVSVAPAVLLVTAAGAAVFFGVLLRKVLRIRHMPSAQGAESIVGRAGVSIGAGLNPDGIVRVSSEEWRATSADGSSIPAGAPVRVIRLDGLMLTVDRASSEHDPAVLTTADEGRIH